MLNKYRLSVLYFKCLRLSQLFVWGFFSPVEQKGNCTSLNKHLLSTIPSIVLDFQIPDLGDFAHLVFNLFTNYFLQFITRNDAIIKSFIYKQAIKNSSCFYYTRKAQASFLKTVCYVELTKCPSVKH